MIAVISTYQASVYSPVVLNLEPGSDYGQLTPRLQRVKTLDGGVVIDNMGVTDGDRTITLTAKMTNSEDAILQAMIRNITSFYLFTEIGVFKGAISDSKVTTQGTVQITFYVESRLSEI